MKSRVIKLNFLWFIMLASAAIASATSEISVSLQCSDLQVKQGTIPHFEVRVRNNSIAAIDVVDLALRSDLRDFYARLSVTQGGAPVLPVGISAPDPLDAGDMRSLGPNQGYEFVITRVPMRLEALGPGTYQAILHFTARMGAAAVDSNSVTFHVVP